MVVVTLLPMVIALLILLKLGASKAFKKIENYQKEIAQL